MSTFPAWLARFGGVFSLGGSRRGTVGAGVISAVVHFAARCRSEPNRAAFNLLAPPGIFSAHRQGQDSGDSGG